MEKEGKEVAYKRKLQGFYQSRGRMPSFSELMDVWGYKTKSAVHYRVAQLEEDGVLKKDAAGKLIPKRLRGGVPLLGLVEAGFPSAAEEELLDVMDFDEYLTPNKDSTYILQVKGDSMIEAGIQPGDLVIAERTSAYKPGQIVIASVDGEFTMKYLRKKGAKYYLEPANQKYSPIYPNESFRVEAVVTGVVRKY